MPLYNIYVHVNTSRSIDAYIYKTWKYVYCFVIQNKIILIRKKVGWGSDFSYTLSLSLQVPIQISYCLSYSIDGLVTWLTPLTLKLSIKYFNINLCTGGKYDLSHGHGFRNRSSYKLAMKHHAPILIARKANLSACKRCHKRGVAEKFRFKMKRTPVLFARTDETPLCVDTIRITQY